MENKTNNLLYRRTHTNLSNNYFKLNLPIFSKKNRKKDNNIQKSTSLKYDFGPNEATDRQTTVLILFQHPTVDSGKTNEGGDMFWLFLTTLPKHCLLIITAAHSLYKVRLLTLSEQFYLMWNFRLSTLPFKEQFSKTEFSFVNLLVSGLVVSIG